MAVSTPQSTKAAGSGGSVRRDFELAAIGAALLLAGMVMMGAVAMAIYGSGPAQDAQAFRLGLAGASLLSALSQISLLTGGWLIWRSTRGHRT